MNQKLIAQIGKSQRLAIINKLKRTQGLPVAELAEMLEMSYMGIKDHCVSMHKEGYLDTWRRAKPRGRPELLYRLTHRAHELFPTASNDMTIQLLESAKQLFGSSAPEKLLFTIFQKQSEAYAKKVKGATIAERAKSLTQLRDKDGHMADLELRGGVLRIVEHHSPILDLLRAFPIVARLEAEMFQRILKTPVHREETAASGLFCCTFTIGARPDGAD